MQYLVSVIAVTADSPALATPEEEAAIDVFNERLQAEGHWVFAGGLGAPEHGHRHRQPGRRADVHRRALHRVEGVPAGFWVLEAADLDVAIKLAAEGSKACNRKIEVRPFL